MYDNCEEAVNYNVLFCHACLSSKSLYLVGDYMDIYRSICDNLRIKHASQVHICEECMALLKEVYAFKMKVENAQKIRDHCLQNQVLLEDYLADFSTDEADEYQEEYQEEPQVTEDLMIRIVNVRGQCDIKDVRPMLDLTTTPSPPVSPLLTSLLKSSPVVITPQFISHTATVVGTPSTTTVSTTTISSDATPSPPVSPLLTSLLKSSPVVITPQFISHTATVVASSCDVTAKTYPESLEDDEECRYTQWKKAAMLIFKTICSHRYAHHFLKPVSDELAPLYSRIVRRPIDLSCIKRWLKTGVVRTTLDLTCALELMFSNALMYNSSCHKIHQMTVEFRKETIRELSVLQEVQSHMDCPPAPLLRRRQSVRECSVSRRSSVSESSTSRRSSVRECSASRRPSVRERSASCRPSVRKSPAPRRPSVRKSPAPRRPSVRKSPAPRRPSVRKSPAPRRHCVSPPVSLLSPAPAERVPHPLTRRRKSQWDASQEARECPVAPAALAGDASPPLALPSRRSAPASVLTRRRKSLWEASAEDEIKTAIAPRPRRKSDRLDQPQSAEPPAKRRAWDWLSQDEEYEHLVASCYKKSAVIL